MFILAAGGITALAAGSRRWAYVGVALVLAHIVSALTVFPNYIAYANEAWGGPNAFLLLPLAGTRRMRRQGRRFGQMVCLLLLALGGIVATTALSGCGSSNGAGFNKPGQGTPYTIAIKATSGAVTHSTTVTLTLQ